MINLHTPCINKNILYLIKENVINIKNEKISRGYCGYFTTSKGQRLYLRSTKEFIVASWLSSLETPHITLMGEWYIGEYRPNFRVQICDKVRLVVEVKDNKRDAMAYIAKYKKAINALGYRYIVIYKESHFSKIIRKLKLNISEWQANTIYDYSGKNNPRYGMLASTETKEKIGKKTKERFQNTEFRERWKKAQSVGITDEVKAIISENTKKAAAKRRAIKDQLDPWIDVSCIWCNKVKVVRFSQKKPITFCDARCASPYYKSIGKTRKFSAIENANRFKKRLARDAKEVLKCYGSITQLLINKAKTDGKISKNSPLSEKSIERYFTNIENMKKEV